MEYDRDGQVLNFVSGLVLGAIIGAGIALLTAPNDGRKMRKRLRKTAAELGGGASDRWDELADDVKEKVEQAVKAGRKRFS
jgi:gas vesicle protein